jgi:hypothetical protein
MCRLELCAEATPASTFQRAGEQKQGLLLGNLEQAESCNGPADRNRLFMDFRRPEWPDRRSDNRGIMIVLSIAIAQTGCDQAGTQLLAPAAGTPKTGKLTNLHWVAVSRPHSKARIL